ncbi:MAG TPA: hypothetical protein VE715_00535 [Blastocatellia bacterium]|nr:hypothetical protein [Blastocatellia bacterium]
MEIDDSGVPALVLLRFGIRANKDDAIHLNRHCFRPRLLIIRGVDVGIGED